MNQRTESVTWKTGQKKIPTQSSKKKKKLKDKENLRNISDNMKCNDIHIMGIPEESKQGIKNISEEVMTTKFPNLVKEKDTQVQKAKKVPNK